MGKSNLPVEKHEVKWKDRKRTIFGLPWSFTRYRLTDDKLIVSTGLFSLNEEEIRLYRIMDVTLKRSFGERLWGLGTIHICSSDKTILFVPALSGIFMVTAISAKQLLMIYGFALAPSIVVQIKKMISSK